MAKKFGASWWGRAWIDALENRARLDPNRLPRGRTYARKGAVYDTAISPGMVRALVQGSRRTPYTVELRLRQLTDDEWSTVIDVVVAKAARAAALLDGELDPELVADADAAGVSLLPGSGELVPRCSCPDWADPCKHSAAVCYIVADSLDADPFALLLLRGMTSDALLAEVRRRRSRAGALDAGNVGPPADNDPAAPHRSPSRPIDVGIAGIEAWQRPLGSLPTVSSHRPRMISPATLRVADVPHDAPFDAEGLAIIAADAAQRAQQSLHEGVSLGLSTGKKTSDQQDRPTIRDDTLEQDLARLAATMLGSDADALTQLAERAGRTPRALARRAIAWRVDGAAGLHAIDEAEWNPPLIEMINARDALVAAGVAVGSLVVKANRITVEASLQLRLTRSGQWYGLIKRGGAWELDSGPADDPDDLI